MSAIETSCFLGSNGPGGFYSLYEGFTKELSDGVLYIIKGRGIRRHGAILRSRIDRAGEELARMEEKDTALRNEAKSLLKSAGILYNEDTVLSDLKRLYDECLDHARLSDKYERFRKNDRSEELDRLSSGINVLFRDFGITADEADPHADDKGRGHQPLKDRLDGQKPQKA